MTSILLKIWLSTVLPLVLLGHIAPFNNHILEKLFMFIAGVCLLSFIAMITSLIWMLNI